MELNDQRKSRWSALRELSAELKGALEKAPSALSSERIIDILKELQDYQEELEQADHNLHSIINELQTSHKRYSDLYDNAPACYLTLNNENMILEVNTAACTLFGLEKRQLLGRMITDFILPDAQSVFASHLNAHKNATGKLSCELSMHNGDGRVFMAQLTSSVLPFGHDRDIQTWAILTDISQRKQDELALQNYAYGQRELNALLQLAVKDISAGDLYQRFLEEVLSFARIGSEQQGLLFLLEKDHLVLKAHKNIARDQLEQCAKIPPGTCLCGQAVAEKKLLFGKSTEREELHFFTQSQPHTHYCVPILTPAGEAIGCLTLHFPENSEYSVLVEEILVASTQVIASIISRKKTEEKLTEGRELLASIYAAADSVGFIVIEFEDDDAKIIRYSPGAQEMFGYREEDVVGQPLSLLFRDQDRPDLLRRIARVRRGIKVQSAEGIMRRNGGGEFPVNASITPLAGSGGQIPRALVVYNDISKLKMIQHELELANAALEQRVIERTQDLQMAQQQVLHAEKLAAIGQLSASIAHEFNNPLQSVMSVLKGVSQRAVLEAEDAELVESAQKECSRMAHLIHDLQDFNRPSSGKRSWMNMHQIIDSLLLLCKSDFRKKNIEIIRHYSDNLPAISAISDQIRQVILNILNNAIDACGPPGCVIAVQTGTVPGGIEFTISDNGCGIEPEHVPRIFEPFFTTKSAARGTGLGLSVCDGIIKKHHGSIKVESRPGQGTSFIVTLPVEGRRDGSFTSAAG